MIPAMRLKYVIRERDDRGHPAERVLSVYRDHGVVPKDSRDDNFNKTPTDLSNYKLVLVGDVVVNKMKAWQGSIAVSRFDGIVSGDYLVCDVTSDAADPEFLHYALRSAPMIQEYGRRSTGIRPSQWRLYWDGLSDITVSLPPLGVQRRVASYLQSETSRIDSIIAKKVQLVDLLEERRAAMVDHAILGIPGEERPVAGLAEYVNGWPFRPDDFTEDGLPVIRIQQLVDPEAPVDRYSGTLPAKARLSDGDLVFSWSGSLQVRIWNRGDAYLNQHLFRVEPAKGIDRTWLRFALEAAIRLFQAHMHGSAMTHITRSTMKSVRVPVPPIADQEEIASMLDSKWASLQSIEARLARQIDLLTEHRQALITTAVTGQLHRSDSIAAEAS